MSSSSAGCGAVVVRGDEVVAAACRLPMSESTTIPGHYHMRHRAGIGLSETTDAIVIIVSEERGEIVVAHDGSLTTMSDELELRKYLEREIRDAGEILRRKRQRRRDRRLARSEAKETVSK